MAEGVSAGRKPEPYLSEPEQTLLALVREGRMDAEIAVRLGLPTSEVKARIERLKTALAVESRAGLREWQPSQAGNAPETTDDERHLPWYRRSRRAAAGGTLCLLLAGAAIWLVWGSGSVGSSGSPRAAAETAATPTTLPRAATSPSVIPRVTFDGEEMFDLGPFMTPPTDVSNREALFVAYFDSPALISLAGPSVVWEVFGSGISVRSLEAEIEGQPIVLNLVAGDPQTSFEENGGSTIRVTGSPAVLTVQSFEQGVGARRHVAITAAGHLLLATGPPPGALVIDSRTGSAVDVGAAAAVPFRFTRAIATACESAGCYAVVQLTGEFDAPFAGRVSCVDGALLLASPDIAITFRETNTATHAGCSPVVPHSVVAGEPIFGPNLGGGFSYVVTAQDSRGAPISTAVSGDGVVYIGPMAPTAGCPCVRGD